jgi:DNA-directed RNA polymerase subunit RPC12/RpoP
VQPPQQARVYAFRCLRCGNALELPHDMRLLHIDCPYCGQDNLLPPELVQARQRQYELDQQHYALQLQEQQRVRQAQEQANARKHSSHKLLIWLLVGGFMAFAALGSCVAFGLYLERQEEAEKLRAQDPKLNGQAALLARFEQMRSQGCSRILVQPSTHSQEPSTISLDMIAGNQCVHVLAMSADAVRLSMRYEGKVALLQPLPAAASSLDYRLCASETATHSFKIDAVPTSAPFTTAAIECPRTPAEGGARSSADDPEKTGKLRVQGMLNELVHAGCKNVVSEPKVASGELAFTVTSPDDAACYNLLAASFFDDVKLSAVLRDPSGKELPVPDPGPKLRVEYCPPKAGAYKLKLTSSTGDFFAYAGVDCHRFGPEGLKRLKRAGK